MVLHNITLGAVALSVSNLARSLAFYQTHLGLRIHTQTATTATLGSDQPLLVLQEIAGARHVRRASGLYHFALRVPTQHDLARIIAHFAQAGTPLAGASDHLVSAALYLDDPDGHGIEIYHDRPRDRWFTPTDSLQMTTLPLDIDAILQDASGDLAWQGMPPATEMGHVHLQVSNLPATNAFYLNVLGFERMMGMSSATFVSADRYHHHLGLNTWASLNAPYPPADTTRLLYATIVMDTPQLNALHARLTTANIPITALDHGIRVEDPSGIPLHLMSHI